MIALCSVHGCAHTRVPEVPDTVQVRWGERPRVPEVPDTVHVRWGEHTRVPPYHPDVSQQSHT